MPTVLAGKSTKIGQSPKADLLSSRLLWVCVLGFALLLSVLATFRGGYVGPDYNTHLDRLIDWQKIFDFSATSPPTYFLLGHGLFRLIGSNNAFPITLSAIQVLINTVAMWWFFLYTENRFKSPIVHTAFVLFLSFLPVRVIHATVIGTDSTTIPLFVLLLFLLDRFFRDKTSSKNAAFLGLGLALAIFTKYSFMALLPALATILLYLFAKGIWDLRRFVGICILTLALPSSLALYSFWASSRVHGYNTEKHWLTKGMPPDMNYRDLFLLKAEDAKLFRAPEYFKRDILAAHKHSYLGLSHLGVFSDPMNLFQDLPVPQHLGSVLIPDQKTRRAWKTPFMTASISLGTIWTFLALLGTPWAAVRALKNVVTAKLAREDIVILFGIAYFLLMFLPIPFVYAGALFGYWTPRLILPALLSFFLAAFLLIDRKIIERWNKIAFVVFVLAIVQCAIEAVVLA